MVLLVRTPPPYPTESLLGYVLRISEKNGYDTPWHVLRLAGIVQDQMRTAGVPTSKLVDVLGIGPRDLDNIAYHELSGDKRYFKVLGHRLGQTLKENPFRLRQPAFCPKCVAEQGFLDASWDLTAMVACPRHGTPLLRACPSCKAPLTWFRPGLLKCRCGASLTAHDAPLVSEGLQALMKVLYRKLHGLPQSKTNPHIFPLQHIDAVPLGPLMQIVRGLGSWNLVSLAADAAEGATDGAEDERAYLAAVDTLQNWPQGFHEMLRRLGEKALNEGVEAAGLRKQFDSFYGSMFKGPDFSLHTGFLRDEFVLFGQLHWGHAVIDVKLLAKQGDRPPVSARFIPRSEYARRYGLWKPTMDRLIRTGAISTKKIKTGKGSRTLVDLDHSQLPVGSQGIVTNREAARRAGLPVSVMNWARKVGLIASKVRVGFESSWHQEDVAEFIERGLALAPAVASCVDGITVGDAMRIPLRKKGARPDILCAIFDGRLSVIGRNGDNFAGLVLHNKEVDAFVQSKRLAAVGDTFSPREAAAATGLDEGAVAAAVVRGLLTGKVVDGHPRVTCSSIATFRSQCVPLASIANELGTLSRRLLRFCHKNGIPVINLERTHVPIPQPVLLVEGATWLRTAWSEDLAKRAATKLSRSPGQREAIPVVLLQAYLDELTQTGKELLRTGGRLNKRGIADACGFGRHMFDTHPVLLSMLAAHDAAERQRNVNIQPTAVNALQRYLTQLRASSMALPIGHNGRPNLLAISKASGCSRDVLTSKPEAQQLLTEFVESLKPHC